MSATDWETWLVEDAGHSVVAKKAASGMVSLNPAERLTYCLWVADYSVRNAGDLATGADLYPAFKDEAATLAETLGLQVTAATFRLPDRELARDYLDQFDSMCEEIADALRSSSSS